MVTARKLAVVLVHYRTPELLRGAIEAVETSAKQAGLVVEGVVVDNGSDPASRPLVDPGDSWRLIEPGDNLGYAGGANRGVEATQAERVVVMNPDAEVLPECLGALVATLDAGVDIAGPRFFWDRGRRFQLPPTEVVSRFDELLRVLADRGEPWRRWARRRWRRHARRHWQASEPLASFDLSGALLAFRRDSWQRIGPFDAGYPLYFEETDWLQRARQLGCRALFVPAAETVHLYAQSTVGEGQAAEWFETSSRRFRDRFYGRGFQRLLAAVAPSQPVPASALPASPQEPGTCFEAVQPASPQEPGTFLGKGSSLGDGVRGWLEVSPSHRGFPAAGALLETSQRPKLPAEILDRLAPGRYLLRRVDLAGKEHRPFVLQAPESAID